MSIPTWNKDKDDGEAFQDFVRKCLWRDGFPVGFYASREFQIMEGEGPAGLEVKFDRQLKEKGNLYIEFAAHNRRTGRDEPSGIDIHEHVFLWAQGDYQRFGLIQKKWLQELHVSGKFREVTCNHKGDVPTKGFLLPWPEFERRAGKLFLNGVGVHHSRDSTANLMGDHEYIAELQLMHGCEEEYLIT